MARLITITKSGNSTIVKHEENGNLVTEKIVDNAGDIVAQPNGTLFFEKDAWLTNLDITVNNVADNLGATTINEYLNKLAEGGFFSNAGDTAIKISIPNAIFKDFTVSNVADIYVNKNLDITTDFDITDWRYSQYRNPDDAGAVVYVDINNGDNANDGSSWSQAKKNFDDIMGYSDTTTKVVYVASGIYDYENSITQKPLYREVSVIGVDTGGGKPLIITADLLTWTLESGNVYTATLPESMSYKNWGAMLDLNTPLNKFGKHTIASKQDSIADVEANANSYYMPDDDTIYVHTFDSRDLSADNSGVYINRNKTQSSSANRAGDFYFENLRFYMGGSLAIANAQASDNFHDSNYFRDVPSDFARYFINKCEFAFVSYKKDGGLSGNIKANTEVYVSEPDVHSNYRDGINFHAVTDNSGKLYVYNGEGYQTGVSGSNADNGVTIHEDITGIVLSGTFHDTYGTPIMNVNRSVMWIIDVTAFNHDFDNDSLGVITVGDTAKIYCDYCNIPVSSKNGMTYYATEDATMELRNCNLDNNGYLGNAVGVTVIE